MDIKILLFPSTAFTDWLLLQSVYCEVRTGSSDINNFNGNFTAFSLLILYLLFYLWQQLLNDTYCNNALRVTINTALS